MKALASVNHSTSPNPYTKDMINLLINLHEAFFDNEMSNKVTMGIGFAMAAVGMLLVFGLFQL